MVIDRDIVREIEPYLPRREYIAIVGPRQCGKTTLFELLRAHLIERKKVPADDVRLVTFENREILQQFEEDPVAFAESFRRPGSRRLYLMLDEFQYAADGGRKLKLLYDTVKGLKVLVTGSSSLEIRARVGAPMVGRMLTFRLHPFGFGECLRATHPRLERVYRERNDLLEKWRRGGRIETPSGADPFRGELERSFERFCAWGGYPAVVLARNDRERAKILSDIFSAYVLKDVRGLLQLDTERELILLSRNLSVQVGNIVVYSNLGLSSDLDFRQLKKHLAVLEKTYVCAPVPPFFANRQKELVKNPKIYFFDTGFRNHQIENTARIDRRPDGGALVENAVFIRLDQTRGDLENVRFWRTKAGAEVDFIVRSGGGILPVEVKYSPFSEPRVPRGMAAFIESFRPKRGLVLTRNYWGRRKMGATDILFAPVFYL